MFTSIVNAISAAWAIIKLVKDLIGMLSDFLKRQKEEELKNEIDKLKTQGKTDEEIADILGNIVRNRF